MRLGFFGARSDNTGLGTQWFALARMLKPDAVVLVDSTKFNGNAQHHERYSDYRTVISEGFPDLRHINWMLSKVDVVLAIETPYTYELMRQARRRGKRVFLCPNWEFLDYNRDPTLARPFKMIAPSPWHLADMQGVADTVYVPPPTFPEDFTLARENNLARTGRRRFLHVVGNPAAEDRAGTQSLLAALSHTSKDFELVIRSQKPLPYAITDPRVTVDTQDLPEPSDLYRGFDAALQPRRYGGLNLPANEALMSALPVIMTAVSPNNEILPWEWCVPVNGEGYFMTRSRIDLYSADTPSLAATIDWLCELRDDELRKAKEQAFEVAMNNYSPEAVLPKWQEVLNED